jgi:hypothetical protein
MRRGVVFARRWVLIAVVAWAAAAGATFWLVRSSAAATSERAAQFRSADELARAIARKGNFDQAHLDEARKLARLHPVPLAAVGSWRGWTEALGTGWQIAPPVVRQHAAYAVRVATVRLVAPTVGDWPRLLGAVRDTESRPGFAVLEVELQSEGDHQHRSMQTMRLVVGMGERVPAEQQSP